MALGRKKGSSGLDLSGVGQRRMRVSGGSMGGHQGLGFTSNNIGSKVASNGGKGAIPRQVPDSQLGGMERERVSPRTVVLAVLAVIAALALAVGVGMLVYQHVLKNSLKPVLEEGQLASLAVVESAQDSYWTVLAKTDSSSGEAGRGALESLALVYADPDNKSISVLWIPVNVRVYIAGYGYHSAGEAFDIGHEAMIVDAVESLAGVDVAHYLELNQAGLENLLEAQGLDVAADGDADEVLTALVRKLLGSSSEQLSTQSGEVLTYVASDLDASGLLSALQALQGLDVNRELNIATMPTTADDDDSYLLANTEEWNTMIERVSSGRDPVADDAELATNESLRAANEVTIWNGAGVSGIASDCATHLEKKGWTIESTGNAASFVYDETLVVYTYDEDEALAQLLVSDLGQGRVVRSAARYSFTGDVLVVVGKDYQPY